MKFPIQGTRGSNRNGQQPNGSSYSLDLDLDQYSLPLLLSIGILYKFHASTAGIGDPRKQREDKTCPQHYKRTAGYKKRLRYARRRRSGISSHRRAHQQATRDCKADSPSKPQASHTPTLPPSAPPSHASSTHQHNFRSDFISEAKRFTPSFPLPQNSSSLS